TRSETRSMRRRPETKRKTAATVIASARSRLIRPTGPPLRDRARRRRPLPPVEPLLQLGEVSGQRVAGPLYLPAELLLGVVHPRDHVVRLAPGEGGQRTHAPL